MNPFVFAMRRPVVTLLLVVLLGGGGLLGFSKLRGDAFPSLNAPKVYATLGDVGTRARDVKGYIVETFESYFSKHEEASHHEASKVVVTTPRVQDITITESFVCQIRSQRHIEVRALDNGYLEEISVKEGQVVKKGDPMFKLLTVLYQTKYEAEKAEALYAERKLNNTRSLNERKVVSENEVRLAEAEFAKAEAKANQAKAELGFTALKAPFNGIVDRLLQREGSLIKEGELLTTLSDNSVMWVYFNVPEKYYLEYMANRAQHEKEDKIELMLANSEMFQQSGTIGAIEADFNNENGNIKFRADYPNPDRLLRHGQTGTIKIRRPLRNAVIIPQRATFDLLDKRYVWIVGEDDVAHRRLIATSKHELEDIYIVEKGLEAKDKIVLEGVREVEEDGKVEFEFREPEAALKNQKFHAE